MNPQQVIELKKHAHAVTDFLETYMREHHMCVHEVTALLVILANESKQIMQQMDAEGIPCPDAAESRYDS